MSEADWKRLGKIVPVIRERYLKAKNAEIAGLLAAGNSSETEKFWRALELMLAEQNILKDCLDDLQRSRMTVKMICMYRHGMIDKTDLESFSEELKHYIIKICEGSD